MQYDVCIIGGGAAGLFSAIVCKENAPFSRVAIIEKNDRVGRKLSLTGNGRCNISNASISLNNYHGNNVDFARFALENFGLESTEEYFKSMGVVFSCDEKGKLYPKSFGASSVVDALRFRAKAVGVEIYTDALAERIEKRDNVFYINCSIGTFTCKSAVLALGGVSGGKIAQDNSTLYKALGLKLTKLSPAIVAVKTVNEVTRQLKGIKVNAKVTVKNRKNSYSDYGEVLFCDYGLSGPPILQLSRYMTQNSDVSIDLFSEYNEKELSSLLYDRASTLDYLTFADFFIGLLNKKVGSVILKTLGYKLTDKVDLDYNECKEIAHTLKNWSFEFTETLGFDNAQVTHGGVATSIVDSESFMVKGTDGLFLAGEMLDIDGDCGGYNLQWAWSSGYFAGLNAAKYMDEQEKI